MQSHLAITIMLILTSWFLKYFIFQLIKKRAIEKGDDKRYLINHLKNLINVLVVVLLFAIWHEEIQGFAFSIAAFVVAIILVTRFFTEYRINSDTAPVRDLVKISKRYFFSFNFVIDFVPQIPFEWIF